MPQLYSSEIEKEIRARFLQKCEELVLTGWASSYTDICNHIQISPASFNQLKIGRSMPTVKMLYNLQVVYKVKVEEILFQEPPNPAIQELSTQLRQVQDVLDQMKRNFRDYND